MLRCRALHSCVRGGGRHACTVACIMHCGHILMVMKPASSDCRACLSVGQRQLCIQFSNVANDEGVHLFRPRAAAAELTALSTHSSARASAQTRVSTLVVTHSGHDLQSAPLPLSAHREYISESWCIIGRQEPSCSLRSSPSEPLTRAC